MSELIIGRLERVLLREVWKHEAYDFTKWLQANIDVLNSALGLSLVNVEREQAAGAFSIDLVAEDENGGKIIIENQLEKSNHDHLGKVLTYLVAMNARAAIWIVAEPRPEHVAAFAWLNDSSSGDFYLVKVEAVRIGTSAPAPMLTLIIGPSAETEAVSRTNKEFAERHEIRQRWWTQLVALPQAKMHAHITPGNYGWIGASTGVRGLGLNYVVMQDECGAELYIDRGNGSDMENKAIFDQLSVHRPAIDAQFDGELLWQRLENRRACRIRTLVSGGYRSPEEEWETIQAAQVEAMNRMNASFQPFLKSLKLNSASGSTVNLGDDRDCVTSKLQAKLNKLDVRCFELRRLLKLRRQICSGITKGIPCCAVTLGAMRIVTSRLTPTICDMRASGLIP